MKTTRRYFLACGVVLVGLCFASMGCSSAIDKVVDNQIVKLVEEENKKLPRSVAHGVMLIRLDYNEDDNKLVMNYSVPDKAKFNANFGRIKQETNAEVAKNGSLKKAFEHGVRLFHEFYTDDELSGEPFQTFQSPNR